MVQWNMAVKNNWSLVVTDAPFSTITDGTSEVQANESFMPCVVVDSHKHSKGLIHSSNHISFTIKTNHIHRSMFIDIYDISAMEPTQNLGNKRNTKDLRNWSLKQMSCSRGTHAKTNMASWKITIPNRRYIFKWLVFHCHVGFRRGSFSDLIPTAKLFLYSRVLKTSDYSGQQNPRLKTCLAFNKPMIYHPWNYQFAPENRWL